MVKQNISTRRLNSIWDYLSTNVRMIGTNGPPLLSSHTTMESTPLPKCSTQTTPFILDNRQHPRLGVEPIWETRLETLREFIDYMEMAKIEACSMQRAANNMVCFYDVHRQHAPTYKVGDRVWLNAQNIATTQPMKKQDHKWLGPYMVNKVISQNVYRLQHPSSFGCTHPVFSTILLWPYEEDPIHEWHSPSLHL